MSKYYKAVMKHTIQQERSNLVIKQGEIVRLEPMSNEVFKAWPVNRHWLPTVFVMVTKNDVTSRRFNED